VYLHQTGPSATELLIAFGQETKIHPPARGNGLKACSSLLAPGERPGGMRRTFDTGAGSLAALSPEFVDGTGDDWFPGEKDRKQSGHFVTEAKERLAEAAQAFILCLNVININNIQKSRQIARNLT